MPKTLVETTGTSQTQQMHRREMIRLASTTTALMASGIAMADAQSSSSTTACCTLGFSTYGMKTQTTERAVGVLSEIGYDALEIAVRSGWDADSATLGKQRRRSLRKQIDQSPLRLTSLMEHVFAVSEKHQVVARERLKLAAGVSHDLSPDSPPLIQTVLGGGDFERLKTQLRDRLGDWVQLANATDTTIAIKPHRGGVISQPAHAVWLIEQLGKPKRLRMVYDYSHFAFRDLPLTETIRTSLPYVSHIAVKDAVQEGDRVVFKLPGETDGIDFAELIRRFFRGGYRGDINCEVSGMVSSRPGYDAIAAARQCYRNMSQAFKRSGVSRPI